MRENTRASHGDKENVFLAVLAAFPSVALQKTEYASREATPFLCN